ncbi:MAG: HEPN domain-containing protein [Candidatus Bathyarchaeia archaeon]|nr:HEPN domain-containing protein [Candidatus Bathyarchaeia archaeon]
MPFDGTEYKRWMSQAEHSLESSRRDMESGDYDWSCFKAQQAAEFAVKGLLYGIGVTAVGHSISKLLGELQTQGIALDKNILSMAKALDRHYIPARYPNAHAAGSPFEFYDLETSRDAVSGQLTSLIL